MNNEIITKKELNKKLLNLKDLEDNCSHEISLEEISCFWGGISMSNKCIFCGKEIKSNNNDSLITFQLFYDEYGDIINPHYSVSSIYNIIKEILKKYNDEDEINLIKEIELLELDNVKINKEQKNKVRKRQV